MLLADSDLFPAYASNGNDFPEHLKINATFIDTTPTNYKSPRCTAVIHDFLHIDRKMAFFGSIKAKRECRLLERMCHMKSSGGLEEDRPSFIINAALQRSSIDVSLMLELFFFTKDASQNSQFLIDFKTPGVNCSSSCG